MDATNPDHEVDRMTAVAPDMGALDVDQGHRRERFEEITREIYEPVQRFLLRRAAREDAEELLDDVLLTIWRRVEDVPADAALPWSYAVARRCLANRRRSQRRAARLIDRLKSHHPPVGVASGESEPAVDVAAALALLSPPDREILTLWAWEQLEPREIAVVLDSTPNAVRLKLSRARGKLAKEIERHDPVSAGHNRGEHAEKDSM